MSLNTVCVSDCNNLLGPTKLLRKSYNVDINHFKPTIF